MELLKDYDFKLQYHAGRANIVANDLSRRPHCTIASLMIREWRALQMMAEYGVQPTSIERGRVLGCMVVQATLVDWIIEAQQEDVDL